VFAVMKVAAEGGCDYENCEFPMQLSSGLIGELKVDVGDTKYRVYFAQPKTDMTLLVALKLGAKTHDEAGQWKTEQNAHIIAAVSRYFTEYSPPA
jgi:hypothetical protein